MTAIVEICCCTGEVSRFAVVADVRAKVLISNGSAARLLKRVRCVAAAASDVARAIEGMRGRRDRAVDAAAARIEAELGPVRAWVNNAMSTVVSRADRITPAEYRRMVSEKATAAYLTGLSLASGTHKCSVAALLDPWHSRATANAKRLRRKK